MRRGLILSVFVGVPAVAFAAPSALSQIAGGLWEISGGPDLKAPVRECVADVSMLAQFEHRGAPCARHVVSEGGSTTLISYKCGGSGFGQSKIEVITPRSLSISTQGISGGLPYNYLVQARRVGDCANTSSVTHH